jgi:multiple sugar transport system substrate-binding protein
MNRKIFALMLTAALLCGLTLTACNRSPSSGGGGSGGVVTLQYADWDKFDTAFIDKWNESHPDIQVVFSSIPDNGEQQTKVDVLAMSGDLDIMPISDGMEFLRMQNGVLAPIDDYIKRDGINMASDFGAFSEWVQHEGRYYCLPLRTSLELVFYNKDMFDAAGVPYPSDDWTLDEYVETVKKMTKGSGQNKVYGTYLHNWDGEWAPLVVQGASGWYTPEGLSNIRDPAFQRGLLLRRELDDGGYQLSFSQISALKTLSNSEFFGGRSAMAVSATWMVRDMKNKDKFPFDFKVGLAYLPRYSKDHPGKLLNMTCSAIGIPANSRHKDEAWEFIRYYVLENSSVIASSGNAPCYKPAWDDNIVERFIENSGLPIDQGRKFFDRDATLVTTRVLGPGSAMYNQILAEQTPLFFNGEKSLEDLLTDIETRVNEILK